MPARCEVEDFISCGLEALIQSIDRYDPAKGATLEQYAWTRIHGAVLDELRRQDWAPRSVRRWERDIDRFSESFSALHGRRPTTDELDLRGAFHHSRAEVDRALALLAAGALDWRSLAAGPIGLDDLAGALAAGNHGPARKWVVLP
jgi:DNA-directed RNA polymerase specialized sigma subunit